METDSRLAEAALTEQVVASFAHTPDARLRTLMQCLVRHLHAFVREAEPTEAEWMDAIRFLTATGQMCDDVVLDVWQTAENGMYSGQDTAQPHGNLRGRYRSDAEGRYAIKTIVPVSYPIPTDGPVGQMLEATGRHPWRPAHLHFMIDAPGHRTLVTHVFDKDDAYLGSDAVFGVKPSLMVEYRERAADDERARRFGFDAPLREAQYDFVLERS